MNVPLIYTLDRHHKLCIMKIWVGMSLSGMEEVKMSWVISKDAGGSLGETTEGEKSMGEIQIRFEQIKNHMDCLAKDTEWQKEAAQFFNDYDIEAKMGEVRETLQHNGEMASSVGAVQVQQYVGNAQRQ